MADDGVIFTTRLRQVFPKTASIETGNGHNLEIRLKRRRVTRIGGRQEDETTGESEVNVYIPPSIFLSFDELATELRQTLCGRLAVNLDDGSISGLAQVVYNNLRGGVRDEVQHTVIVVIVEVEEMEDLPGDSVDVYDFVDEYEHEVDEDENEDVGEEMVRVEIDAASHDYDEEEMVHVEIDAASHDYDPCAICWNEFAVGTGILKLPCDHLFHEECIRAWLERRWNCPLCRKRIKVD
uniref:RING-type domain-containing protein n=1 Tax=Kalanchoe fedtschenkoi TaxID=63787 RepID=A0A7N0V8U7_KALFE